METTNHNILFTAVDKTVIRANVELTGKPLTPPKYVQFRGKLYQHKGSGVTATFYHEVNQSFQMLETNEA